jgi:Transcriptional regulator
MTTNRDMLHMEGRELFQNPTAISILKLLERSPNLMSTEIEKIIETSRQTIHNRLQDLVHENAVTEERHYRHNKKTYSLTEYGIRVLTAINILQKTINKEEIEEDDYVGATAPET